MAISPKESAIHSSHEEKAKKVIKLVDEKLTDQNVISLYEMDNGAYKIIVPGNLNVSEKEYVKQEYLKAGWSEVAVSNSSDNGERPGLVCVNLKQY